METILNLFNTELGAKARATLVAIGGVAVAVNLVLTDVLDVVSVLPSTGATATVVSVLTGAITYVGRFTKIGEVKQV